MGQAALTVESKMTHFFNTQVVTDVNWLIDGISGLNMSVPKSKLGVATLRWRTHSPRKLMIWYQQANRHTQV